MHMQRKNKQVAGMTAPLSASSMASMLTRSDDTTACSLSKQGCIRKHSQK